MPACCEGAGAARAGEWAGEAPSGDEEAAGRRELVASAPPGADGLEESGCVVDIPLLVL